MPDPGWSLNGLGMNEALMPCDSATSFTTTRKVIRLSAVDSASAYRRSISCWPGRALVVGELHRDAHLLEHRDRLAAEVAAGALRGVVEVAGLSPPARAGRPGAAGP